ncbi:hypothetical protein BDV96DRAFT_195472 [Lophiotrema nucula]|uniref:CorA-like transporter domain-containing protein n=1 Tax=Lophiotrema nucula TaxID=690887 RepID=A0A6A5YTT8_9PLEO|nr:hypothetical protein BDV96DRAFT_195472 [Lophiotrema nucula]
MACATTFQDSTRRGWKEYLQSVPCSDAQYNMHLERLAQQHHRLFSGQGTIERWRVDADQPGKFTQSIFDMASYASVHLFRVLSTDRGLQNDVDSTRDTIYYISQKTSWSHLEVSAETMQKLLISYSVPIYFLEALYAFGAKVTGDDDPHFNFCKTRVLSKFDGRNEEDYDICYLIRRYELHGRSALKNPWSLRQTLVYQRFHSQSRSSTWIFVQLFKECRMMFQNMLSSTTHNKGTTEFHKILLESTLAGWRWYLNYLRVSLEPFKDKAWHYPDPTLTSDYEVTVLDCQRVERVISNLSLSQHILRATDRIRRDLNARLRPTPCKQKRRQVDDPYDYSDAISAYIEQSLSMQAQAERVSLFLRKQLDITSIGTSNDNTKRLTLIGATAWSQRDDLKTLLSKASLDSHFMLLLAAIGVLFLPANLLAEIFSSALVYVPSAGEESERATGVLHVRKAMGVYVALTFLLTSSTVGVALVCACRSRLL